MEKIKFTFEDTSETVEFFVLEQTKINGAVYIPVSYTHLDVYKRQEYHGSIFG